MSKSSSAFKAFWGSNRALWDWFCAQPDQDQPSVATVKHAWDAGERYGREQERDRETGRQLCVGPPAPPPGYTPLTCDRSTPEFQRLVVRGLGLLVAMKAGVDLQPTDQVDEFWSDVQWFLKETE